MFSSLHPQCWQKVFSLLFRQHPWQIEDVIVSLSWCQKNCHQVLKTSCLRKEGLVWNGGPTKGYRRLGLDAAFFRSAINDLLLTVFVRRNLYWWTPFLSAVSRPRVIRCIKNEMLTFACFDKVLAFAALQFAAPSAVDIEVLRCSAVSRRTRWCFLNSTSQSNSAPQWTVDIRVASPSGNDREDLWENACLLTLYAGIYWYW